MTRISEYDKFPAIPVQGVSNCAWQGWSSIVEHIRGEVSKGARRLAVECYPGVFEDEISTALTESLMLAEVVRVRDSYKSPQQIEAMTSRELTDDPVFGRMNGFVIKDFVDPVRVASLRQKLDRNSDKVTWRVADRIKKELLSKIDFLLDTTDPDTPKMVTGDAFRAALKLATTRPFRVVPFFDPGPWGGQWMREVCGLDAESPNYAWCFDCVPEENSLRFEFGNVVIEIPAINLVFQHPRQLLGDAVHARFGSEFPIRFDFLDTMNGGNLSLQVHPLTEYIQEKFGVAYTQDESYYLLDAAPDACVYLGLKSNIDREQMGTELLQAQENGTCFDADKYVNKWPARRHDHFLIPAGTIHCSGRNSMVLEISATPYIFTFKLWDWGRPGLDGKPRPIHLDHGLTNIQWDRDTEWVKDNLINRVCPIARGPGWTEERTGLHAREFIETRRHWFDSPVLHENRGSVHVLNLVEGNAAVIDSPGGSFDEFVVHYAETFIVPAAVEKYRVRPLISDTKCATIGASVRIGS